MNPRKVQIVVLSATSALMLFIASSNGQERRKEKEPDKEKSAAKVDPAVIAGLIADLGSDAFETREKASRRLAQLDEVPEALRRAARDSDPEVARRARTALTMITERLEERAFQAMLRDLHKVELDRFVRRIVARKKADGEKEGKIVRAIAKAVTAEANKCAGRRIAVSDFAVDRMRRVLLDAESNNRVSGHNSVILSVGATPYITSVRNSLVIVDGDFTGATGINGSVLIVRGNVGRITSVSDSIILATGNWDGATVCNQSFVQVNNHRIRFTGSRDCVFINTLVRTTGNTDSRVITTDKGPLHLVKFSPRPADGRLAWSEEVENLTVALVGVEENGRLLIRWKNVGKEPLQLPWVRFHSSVIDSERDDLLGHVFLQGQDGKVAPAREHPAPRRQRFFDRCVILGPGRTYEETINLWTYVEKPQLGRKYQLSIELDIPKGRRVMEHEVKTWSGKIRSKTREISVDK